MRISLMPFKITWQFTKNYVSKHKFSKTLSYINDGYNNDLYTNIFDRYCLRSEYLNEFSRICCYLWIIYHDLIIMKKMVILMFTKYCQFKYIRLPYDTKMKWRTRLAVLRTRYYIQIANREAYLYNSYLVFPCFHVSFRKEEKLLRKYESAKEAFNAKRHLLTSARRTRYWRISIYRTRSSRSYSSRSYCIWRRNKWITSWKIRRSCSLVEELCDYNVDFDLHDEFNETDHVISVEEFNNNIRSMNIE